MGVLSYLRTEDLLRSVRENLPYINEPIKANFEAFVYESELINANMTSAINSLKMKESCTVTSILNGLAEFHDLRQCKQDNGCTDRQSNLARCRSTPI